MNDLRLRVLQLRLLPPRQYLSASGSQHENSETDRMEELEISSNVE